MCISLTPLDTVAMSLLYFSLISSFRELSAGNNLGWTVGKGFFFFHFANASFTAGVPVLSISTK